MTSTHYLTCVGNQQLLTELNPEETASISGGTSFTIQNKLNQPVSFLIVSPITLAPLGSQGDTATIDLPNATLDARFDKILGTGTDEITRTLQPGTSSFDLEGAPGSNIIKLVTGSDTPANLR